MDQVLAFTLARNLATTSSEVIEPVRNGCIRHPNTIRSGKTKMKKLMTICAVSAIALVMTVTAQASITIDTVTVSDARNSADSTGYGAVSYAYNIGKYEVTNAQYAAFLNAVDASGVNPNGIYNVNMGDNPRGGIAFTIGAVSGAKYTVRTNMGDKPVNYVSWYDAARFTNWFGNGQGNVSTETGAYTLNSNVGIITKNVGATVYIAGEDEWYKAAYYKGGSTNAGYWLYATKSDTAPTMATANTSGNISNPGANVANYDSGADWNSQNGNVTTVGSAGVSGASFYGTFDQGGNVLEWNDAIIGGSSRGVRGGSWILASTDLSSSYRYNNSPSSEAASLGFRIASVPEPATIDVLSIGVLGLLRRKRRA